MNENEGNVSSCFVDANIWLYAFIEVQETQKSSIAKDLIRKNDPVVSTQVVNEVCVNLIRKAQFSEEHVRQLISSFYSKYPVVGITESVLLTASDLRGDYSLSFWDSLVVSSALRSGTPLLYSEDMQNGLLVRDRLRIINPFEEM